MVFEVSSYSTLNKGEKAINLTNYQLILNVSKNLGDKLGH
jgi:hypothetical protein